VGKQHDHIPLYETEAIRNITGLTIRPGGLSLTDRAMELCGFEPDAFIADIGCGYGRTIEHLRRIYRINAYGLDPTETMLTAGLGITPGLPVIRGNAETLPFKNSTFDGLICECVLSLVTDQDAAIAEFSRTLKPKGLLIITDMYTQSLAVKDGLTAPGNICCIQGARTRDEMEQLFLRHGFSIEFWEDHTKALKQMAAQLILSHGSLDDFWRTACKEGLSRDTVLSSAAAKPGYCLLIGRNSAK
jgi:arsenite methyltransferase